MEMDELNHRDRSLNRNCRRRSRKTSSTRNKSKQCYKTLIGGEYPNELIDCQIIIVNPRQRFYF